MIKKYFYALAILFCANNIYSQEIKNNDEISNAKFNSWSATLYLGTALIQTGDLTSIQNGVGNFKFGYDVQLGVSKALTHAFGLTLLVQKGQTKQEYQNNYSGETDYQALSLLGDLNLTTLFRRLENKTEYKWSLHTFAGFGLMDYEAKRNIIRYDTSNLTKISESGDAPESFTQAGFILFYKLNKRFDLSFKGTYYFLDNEEFDGSGLPYTGSTNDDVADVEETRRDGLMTFHLGLTYKIGRNDQHLMWIDPLQELYRKANAIEALQNQDFKVCNAGDADKDGVCDDWDKCLKTPEKAVVTGDGCPLDSDKDGIIDFFDKCPMIAGEKVSYGCPNKDKMILNGKDDFEPLPGIEFGFDSAIIKETSYPYLEKAYKIISEKYADQYIYVEGHADERGDDNYNMELSRKRAESVIQYLVTKGLDKSKLIAFGKGETELLYSECVPASKCDESKNEANRRVVFKLRN